MTPVSEPRTASIDAALRVVEDPEVSVTLHDLGVLRGFSVDGDTVTVALRPTRLGCPGRDRMERDVIAAVQAVDPTVAVTVNWEFMPWSEADITPAGKAALSEIGYTVLLGAPARCPYCSSDDVRPAGEFGGALCKAPYTCRRCGSTFDALRSALSALIGDCP